MNILVIGSGGREHALIRSLAVSPRMTRLFCLPGNAGTAGQATNVDLTAGDYEAMITFARENDISLTVVGPEAPLCDGIVDRFEQAGLRIFGPSAAAARIEGDKAYAKRLMKTAAVPTAEARIFKHLEEAKEYINSRDTGMVIKAAGLAAGKGVFVCDDPPKALQVLDQIMVDRAFGEAGDTVVVEELLKGEELSVFALVDGHTIYVLDSAQDHKRVGEGDTGLNTGGMGAYSPAPSATPALLDIVQREILVPIVDALNRDDAPYKGVLYAGLMLTPGGPKVLEFNCRFGDPETQAVLPRLESDLLEALEATVDGRLAEIDIRWKPEHAVTVVMASAGYPESYEKGKVICGLDAVEVMDHVVLCHAGTTHVEDRIVTAGGRVLSVTGLGNGVAQARQRAYDAAERIEFDGAFYRTDIAHRALG